MVTKTTDNNLQSFVNRCLCQILNIKWPDTISNNSLWKKNNQDPIEIKRGTWRWIDYTLHKSTENIAKLEPSGKEEDLET